MTTEKADESSTPSRADAAAAATRLRLRSSWGWLEEHFEQWLLDRRRRRLIHVAIAVGFTASTAVVVLAIVLALQAVPHGVHFEGVLKPGFPPSALYSGDGVLYAGSEQGDLAAYDPISSVKLSRTLLAHPIHYLTVHGDHVFAAGQEYISRLTPSLHGQRTYSTEPLTLTGLASGPLGLWGVAESGGVIVHFASETLTPINRITVPAPVHGLAISALGIWSLAKNKVLLSRRQAGTWRTTSLELPCEPRAVSTEHDRAFILCTTTAASAGRIYVLSDTNANLERAFNVLPHVLGLGLSGGTIWLLAPSDDRIAQYSLATGAPIGPPVPVGTSAAEISASPSAVWIGEATNTVLRIDQQRLAFDRSARYQAHRSRSRVLPAWAWWMLAAMLIAMTSALMAMKRRVNPYSSLPGYVTPPRIFVFMLDKGLYNDLASGVVFRRTLVRRRFAELRHKLAPGVVGSGTDREAERRKFPKAMHVRETIMRLVKRRIPYRGLNYVYGVRHRGTRKSAARTPSESALLALFVDVTRKNPLCLIAGSDWLVRDAEDPSRDEVTLELTELLDRVVGDTRRHSIPEGARVRLSVRKKSMKKIARERCVPGARVRLDVIALARPYEEGAAPTLDCIVAWQPLGRS